MAAFGVARGRLAEALGRVLADGGAVLWHSREGRYAAGCGTAQVAPQGRRLEMKGVSGGVGAAQGRCL